MPPASSLFFFLLLLFFLVRAAPRGTPRRAHRHAIPLQHHALHQPRGLQEGVTPPLHQPPVLRGCSTPPLHPPLILIGCFPPPLHQPPALRGCFTPPFHQPGALQVLYTPFTPTTATHRVLYSPFTPTRGTPGALLPGRPTGSGPFQPAGTVGGLCGVSSSSGKGRSPAGRGSRGEGDSRYLNLRRLTASHPLPPPRGTRGGPLPPSPPIYTPPPAAPPSPLNRAAPFAQAPARQKDGVTLLVGRPVRRGLRPASPRPSPSRTPQGGVQTAVSSHQENLLLGPAHPAPRLILIGRRVLTARCDWAARCPSPRKTPPILVP